MAKNKWLVSKQNLKLSKTISEKLNISTITAQVLINRGIESVVEAEAFLNPSLFDLPSPFLMKDMDKAVDRIINAINNRELIAIYGDYDVDGVTATSLLYNFLNYLECNVIYYNPERYKEGYGINSEAINKLNNEGVSLIISVDCGVTAVDEVELANNLGLDVIITDHHLPPNILPSAFAILNPHQKSCDYPGKEITGVGVAFNLTIAIRRKLREIGYFKDEEPNLGDYLDLVALGTVADCASLTNINRIIVREGLIRMEKPKREGIKALKKISGISGSVSSFDLGFKLGPRINAVGRLSSAQKAVELFTSNKSEIANNLADILNTENLNRRSIEREITDDAVRMVESSDYLNNSNSIVLFSKHWHQGVIGIVASRLVDRYNKPVFLIVVDEDGVGKGSGRSIPGINLYNILFECKEVFDNFGGHSQAAGITIKEERIDEFRSKIEKIIDKKSYSSEKEIHVDCKIDFNKLTDELIGELDSLSPFGLGNPRPVFMTESVEILSRKVFKGDCISFKVKSGDKILDAMWFNAFNTEDIPEKMNIIFTPEFNIWNGKKNIRLTIKDADYNKG